MLGMFSCVYDYNNEYIYYNIIGTSWYRNFLISKRRLRSDTNCYIRNIHFTFYEPFFLLVLLLPFYPQSAHFTSFGIVYGINESITTSSFTAVPDPQTAFTL